jgi:hypothetical protein
MTPAPCQLQGRASILHIQLIINNKYKRYFKMEMSTLLITSALAPLARRIETISEFPLTAA